MFGRTVWVKEVEMVDSVDELKSSRSIAGKDFPNLKCWTGEMLLLLNKIMQDSHFKKVVSLEEQKAQKEDRFQRGRQIAFIICDYFRVPGAHDTVSDYADSFSVTLHDDNVQEFDTRWDEVLLSMSKLCRNCNSTNSLLPHHSWCGRPDSKHRFQMVLIFPRRQYYGSKKGDG